MKSRPGAQIRWDHPISIRVDDRERDAMERDLADLNREITGCGGKAMTIGGYAKIAVLAHSRHRFIVAKITRMVELLSSPGFTTPVHLEFAEELSSLLVWPQ